MAPPVSGNHPERRLASLARVLKLLRETEEFEQLVPNLLEALQKELHYTLLWLGLYDRQKHHVVSQGFIASQPHRLLKSTFALEAGDLMEQVLMQQRPLLVNDLRQESRIGAWNELAAELSVQGALLFPIRRRDVCYGMFLFGSPQWGQPINASDRTFISTTSSTLADLLCQREKVQQEQLRKNPGDSIFSLLAHLQGLTDSDAQLEAAAKAVFQLIEPDQVRIFWLNPEKFEFWERLSLSARRGSTSKRFAAASPGLTLPISEMRGVYQILNNQQLLVVGESQGSVMANVPKQFLQTVNAEAFLAAP
ncbi:MAG: GAF domain-containing protein, partial [Cyanobacteria bacterium P01_H01_bin.58]